jgi:hypothetical protein
LQWEVHRNDCVDLVDALDFFGQLIGPNVHRAEKLHGATPESFDQGSNFIVEVHKAVCSKRETPKL